MHEEELKNLKADFEKTGDRLNIFYMQFYNCMGQVRDDTLKKIANASASECCTLEQMKGVDEAMEMMIKAKEGYIECVKKQAQLRCEMVELDTSMVISQMAERFKNIPVITPDAELSAGC